MFDAVSSRLGVGAAPIPLLMPRFWWLVARTSLGKRAHWQSGNDDYRLFLRSFYTRQQTADVEFYGDAYRELRPLVAELADVQAGDSVLDIATGGGHQAAAFAGSGRTVVGIDYVHDRVRLAAENHAGVEVSWSSADATALPFADGAFDIVTVSLALHDMPVEVQRGALSEMRRVARKRVVVLEPRPPRQWVWKQIYTAIGETIDESTHFRDFAMCDFEANLAAAGLDIQHRRRCYHGALVVYVCQSTQSA